MKNQESTIDELLPPKHLRLAVGGSFKQIGQEFFQYFIELGGLQPHESVLDVGCGVGRMAIPLTGYLSDRGSYEGFDIVDVCIQWCRDCISPRYPHFNFQFADIYNKSYNPTGHYRASDYRFPYPDNRFDFVFLTSVFTHILPDGLENYLSEIARVLKPGGRGLMTFYLLNQESLQAIAENRSAIAFKHDFQTHRLLDVNIPESAVAYPEEFMMQICHKQGLKIQQPIYYGSWCGRTQFLSAQDVVLVSKP